MRDPENTHMRMRADGSSRRTSPYKVPDPDFSDLEEKTPLTALKIHYQAKRYWLLFKMLKIQQYSETWH
eukprot:5497310-Prorocentrum_lima.AAC.1